MVTSQTAMEQQQDQHYVVISSPSPAHNSVHLTQHQSTGGSPSRLIKKIDP